MARLVATLSANPLAPIEEGGADGDYETDFVERALKKFGKLLQIAFGEAGSGLKRPKKRGGGGISVRNAPLHIFDFGLYKEGGLAISWNFRTKIPGNCPAISSFCSKFQFAEVQVCGFFGLAAEIIGKNAAADGAINPMVAGRKMQGEIPKSQHKICRKGLNSGTIFRQPPQLVVRLFGKQARFQQKASSSKLIPGCCGGQTGDFRVCDSAAFHGLHRVSAGQFMDWESGSTVGSVCSTNSGRDCTGRQTVRNQTPETTFSVQFVPGMRFLVFDFGLPAVVACVYQAMLAIIPIWGSMLVP
eukprot:2609551-Rhodomonas_salina.2